VISAPLKRVISTSRIQTSSAMAMKELLFTLSWISIILAVPTLSTPKQNRILAKQGTIMEPQGTKMGPPGPISPRTSLTLDSAVQSCPRSAGNPGISVMMKPVGFAPKTCPGTFLVEDVRSDKKSGALSALFKDVVFGGSFECSRDQVHGTAVESEEMYDESQQNHPSS
jgi:hypothetical protein